MNIKTLEVLRSKAFYFGFFLAAIPIVGLNVIRETITSSYTHQFGFPFSGYETKLMDAVETTAKFTIYDSISVGHFVWIGSIGNILIGTLICIAIGLSFATIARRIWPSRLDQVYL